MEKNNMRTYWTSVIIFNEGDSKPWLCAMSSPQFSLERAMKEVERLRENYNVDKLILSNEYTKML